MANALQWIFASRLIFFENFESGVRPSVNWQVNDGVFNFTPALQGSFSMSITGMNSVQRAFIGSSWNELFGHFLFRTTALPSGGAFILSLFQNNPSVEAADISLAVSGAIIITGSGGASGTSVGTMLANTTYHVWFHYLTGTGANGFFSVGFSTTATEPTSGNNFISFSNATYTTPIDRLSFRSSDPSGMTAIFDDVSLSPVSIGNNPL